MAELRRNRIPNTIDQHVINTVDEISQQHAVTRDELDHILVILSDIVGLNKGLNGCMQELYKSKEISDKVLEEVKNSSDHMLQQYIVDRIYNQDEFEDIKMKLDKIIRNHEKEVNAILTSQTEIQKSLEENGKSIIDVTSDIELELEETRHTVQRMTNTILIGLAGSLGTISGLLIFLINVILNMG